MSELINSKERSDLRRLEKVIDEGKRTFVEVGSALKQIRDGKLHRETHGNFAEYVEERFGFSKRNANYLIEASVVVVESGNHGSHLQNERQAREVAKAPEELREAVIDRAAEIAEETGKPPTAETYRQAREEVLAEPEIEPATVIMTPVEMAIANAACLNDLVNGIRAMRKKANAIVEGPGLLGFINRRRRVMDELQNAINEVQVVTPHAICPRCKGRGCEQCGMEGWVNSILFRELT